MRRDPLAELLYAAENAHAMMNVYGEDVPFVPGSGVQEKWQATVAELRRVCGIVREMKLPTRGDVARPEMTRDPIFLLQVSRTKRGPHSDEYDDDDCDWWDTESVWFTREEAEAFAKAHAYRWPNGWRVYCTCAEGELASLLRERSDTPTGKLLR